MVNQLLDTPNASAALHDPNTPPSYTDDQLRATGNHHVGILKDQYPTVVEEIVDSIHQLHLELSTTDDEPDLGTSINTGRDVDDECIFGLSISYSQQAILSRYMPPGKEADQLLATYFGGDTFIQPFIHTLHFQRQYRTFQKDCFLSAPPLWLSTLFSIFSIAAMVHNAVPAEKDSRKRSHRLRTAAGQCLVLGKYHNTQRYAPEALLLYAHCKGLESLDPSHECGAIISMAVRHAYELGYHRDPDTFGKFNVFEGEMRRRFWACCKQVDIMVSFQLGLPSNIIFDNCDTKSPLNLLDSDFDIDTQELPRPRPESEATAILWFIVKDRLLPIFAKICQVALSLRIRTEVEIMELDTEAKRAYAGIPDVLRWRPVSDSIGDSPFLIMCRLFLELLYLKSLCILHRRYMVRGSAYSAGQCIEGAISIVRSVVDVHRELQPGGRLHGVSWMFNNIAMTDFLLGAIILCFYVNLDRRGSVSRDSASDPTIKDVLVLLGEARSICVARSMSSSDARKVDLAIQLTLESENEFADKSVQPLAASGEGPHQRSTFDAAVPEFSASIDAYMDHYSFSEGQLTFSELDPFNFMSDGLTDMDMFWSSNGFAQDLKDIG
jgi:hypothetical protein